MAIEKGSQRTLREGSAPVCFLCPLMVAFFPFIALFLGDEPVFDEMGVLTSWATHKRLLVKWVLIGP